VLLKSAAYDEALQRGYVQQQQQVAFAEYSGERGRQELARVAEAAIAEITERTGYTRDQIAAAYNSDPTTRSLAAQEAAIAMGRQRIAREGIKAGRARPKPPVMQRPGTASLPGERPTELTELSNKLSRTGKLKDAAALLVAQRKGR
jgi:hypothetical protein